MIGFILWLVLFIGCSAIYTIFNLIKIAGQVSIYSIFETYRYFKVTKPMIKNGTIERKKIEQHIIEEEKRLRDNENLNNQRNKIIKAGINKVQELRIRYQYADENLFQLYLKKYPIYASHELREIEKRIINSHLINE